ncbi:MAG: metallophosphoesterase, partial [Deltaproteobacteria bacterium]
SARSRRFESFFGDLMWRDGAERVYPWFKDLGEVKLVGFNSAFPTAPLMAIGGVDEGQLGRLAALAADGALDEGCAFALVHHNLHPRGWRKDRMHGLQNRDAFARACADAGVSVVLHGHTHKAHRFSRDGLTIIGCGSSTWSDPSPDHTARYNVYEVADGALRATEIRQYDPTTAGFTTRSAA